MANTRVHTVAELREIFREQSDRIAAIQRLLDTAEKTQERMYKTGHLLSEVKTKMDALYGDIEEVSNEIEASLGAIMSGVTWAWPVEVRVGLTGEHTIDTDIWEVKYLSINGTVITAVAEDGDPLDVGLNNYLAVGDLVELVNPEDPENGQIMEATSASAAFVTLVATIPGGTVNLTDSRAKLVLKVDASL